MKKFAVLCLVVGIILILSVIFGFSISFWRIVELILGINFIVYAVFKGRRNVHVHMIHDKDGNEYEIPPQQAADIARDTIKQVHDNLDEQEIPAFPKSIAMGSLKFAESVVGGKKYSAAKLLKRLLFGFIAGTILIFDSLNLFGLKLNFWEVLLVIFGSAFLAYGISSFFFKRGE